MKPGFKPPFQMGCDVGVDGFSFILFLLPLLTPVCTSVVESLAEAVPSFPTYTQTWSQKMDLSDMAQPCSLSEEFGMEKSD